MNPLAEAVGDLGDRLHAEGARHAAIVLHVTAALVELHNASALQRLADLAVQIAQERLVALRAMDN